MLSDIRSALRPAFSLLILFTAVLGLAYPLLMTGVSQVLMPGPANGSLIVRDDKVIADIYATPLLHDRDTPLADCMIA